MKQYPGKMDKTKKANYFVGKKRLKHVKLFESFVNEGHTPMDISKQAALAVFSALYPESEQGDSMWKSFTRTPLAMLYKKLSEKSNMWMVFNGTDGIYATMEPLSAEEAVQFIIDWPKRYERQGYYKTNRWEQIPADQVKLTLEEWDENMDESTTANNADILVKNWLDMDPNKVGNEEHDIIEYVKSNKDGKTSIMNSLESMISDRDDNEKGEIYASMEILLGDIKESRAINEGKMKALFFAGNELKDAFGEYLENKDKDALLDRIDAIENSLRGDLGIKDPKKGMWWRFYKNDTGANTVQSLARDLKLPASHGNHKFAIENMEATQEPDNEITVYFS